MRTFVIRKKTIIELCFIIYSLLFITDLQAQLELPSNADATPALDAAAAATCKSKTNRIIQLPAGVYYFSTQPKPFTCALNLIGQGKGATRLIRNYSGGAFLEWQRGTDQSGGSVSNMNIEAGPKTQNGIAIYIKATADSDASQNSYNRHSFSIDNVLVGRSVEGCSFDFGLYLDGSQNPDNNKNSVPGIRGIYVARSSFGGTNKASIYLNKARGIDLHAECYTPVNNSFGGVVLDNETRSVRLDTRTCLWATWDNTGTGMIFNGQNVGPQ